MTPSSNPDGDDETNIPDSSTATGSPIRRKPRARPTGSMYLDESNEVHFYQSELVFLNGFNMTCLLSDYAKGPPDGDGANENMPVRAPLPDYIEGRVLEIENVHLSPEVRKRMPFLNHIPLYTDIVFVELDLNHILTEETRRQFKVEIAKRRRRRQAKIQAEKRADRAAQKEEMERINERKARLQIIDPSDEFFHIPDLPPDPQQGADFGPALSASNSRESETSNPTIRQTTTTPSSNQTSTISFSDALRRGHDSITISSTDAFPALGSPSEAFPALGTSGSKPTGEKKPAVSAVNVTQAPGGGGKKKKKGQKLVLFSTGGARGY